MLFDLDKDISEQNDISEQFPEKTARMQEMLRDWEKDVYSSRQNR